MEKAFADWDKDVHQQWKLFINIYQEAKKQCIPKRIVESPNSTYSVPLDRKSSLKIKRKNRLWERYLNTKDGEVYLEYCNLQIRRITRKAQIAYERNITKESRNIPKNCGTTLTLKQKRAQVFLNCRGPRKG